MHEFDVKVAGDGWIGVVENVPIIVHSHAFETWREFVNFIFGELIANALDIGVRVLKIGSKLCVTIHWRSGPSDAWRS